MVLHPDVNNELMKALPVVGATGADVVFRFMGLTLNEWFYIAAIIYTVFIIADKAVDVYKKAKYKQDWTIEDDRIRKSDNNSKGGER